MSSYGNPSISRTIPPSMTDLDQRFSSQSALSNDDEEPRAHFQQDLSELLTSHRLEKVKVYLQSKNALTLQSVKLLLSNDENHKEILNQLNPLEKKRFNSRFIVAVENYSIVESELPPVAIAESDQTNSDFSQTQTHTDGKGEYVKASQEDDLDLALSRDQLISEIKDENMVIGYLITLCAQDRCENILYSFDSHFTKGAMRRLQNSRANHCTRLTKLNHFLAQVDTSKSISKYWPPSIPSKRNKNSHRVRFHNNSPPIGNEQYTELKQRRDQERIRLQELTKNQSHHSSFSSSQQSARDTWVCRVCKGVNAEQIDRCVECCQKRPRHTPPYALSTPYPPTPSPRIYSHHNPSPVHTQDINVNNEGEKMERERQRAREWERNRERERERSTVDPLATHTRVRPTYASVVSRPQCSTDYESNHAVGGSRPMDVVEPPSAKYSTHSPQASHPAIESKSFIDTYVIDPAVNYVINPVTKYLLGDSKEPSPERRREVSKMSNTGRPTSAPPQRPAPSPKVNLHYTYKDEPSFVSSKLQSPNLSSDLRSPRTRLSDKSQSQRDRERGWKR